MLENARLVASSLFILRFEGLSLCLTLSLSRARSLSLSFLRPPLPSPLPGPLPPHTQTNTTHTHHTHDRFREIRRRMLPAWSQQAHNQRRDRALKHCSSVQSTYLQPPQVARQYRSAAYLAHRLSKKKNWRCQNNKKRILALAKVQACYLSELLIQ